MSLSPGQKISSYEVIGSIGVGGMGEVFRARDVKLDRDVAIKVLPEAWGDEKKHVQRFEREAKVLASLNHPNVAHVYGFGDFEGEHLLVLELVEGEELAERIGRGPLPLDETKDLCRQIAEGLEAAHELGVIHRDLKPANVRITPRGVAKVLDFGLAKSLRREWPTGDTPAPSPSPTPNTTFQTEDGLLIGTPTYMSPEQTRGRHVDRRADIWAFGCVLYECLTGKPPFEGESLPDTLAAIVKDEPDLALLPPDTPDAIRDLIFRCLDKDPRSRLRDIGEARLALDRGYLMTPHATPTPVPAVRAPESSAKPSLMLPAVIVAVGLVVAAAIFSRPQRDAQPDDAQPEQPEPRRPSNPLEGATIEPVADFPGTEFDACISRDGRFLSFVSDRDGQFDVWIGRVGTGNFRNLTNGRKTEWNYGGVRDAFFDRDATLVYLSQGDDRWMWCVPILGGEMRRSHERKFNNTVWSPDGSRVVYHTSDPGDPVYVADADFGNRKQILLLDEGLHQHFPTWSTDGEWVYVAAGRPAAFDMQLWRVRPDGTDREQLTTDLRDVRYPTSIDPDTVLFIAYESNGAGPWLWTFDVPSRTLRRAMTGVERFTSVAVSGDGRLLVATVANPRPQLWSVPLLPDRGAEEADVERVAGFESLRASGPRFTRSGDVFFLSSRGLWLRTADGDVRELLSGSRDSVLEPPAVSPDGRRAAVVSLSEGRPRLRVVTVEGAVHDLPDSLTLVGAPCWSPDGAWIVIGGSDADGEGLFKFPADGGAPERMAWGHASHPIWSPTDDLVVFAGTQIQALCKLRGVRPSDREEVPLPEVGVHVLWARFRFLPDGSGIVFLEGRQSGREFGLLDLGTKKARRIARISGRGLVGTFDVDPTGKRIVFDREPQNSDVVLIKRAGDD